MQGQHIQGRPCTPGNHLPWMWTSTGSTIHLWPGVPRIPVSPSRAKNPCPDCFTVCKSEIVNQVPVLNYTIWGYACGQIPVGYTMAGLHMCSSGLVTFYYLVHLFMYIDSNLLKGESIILSFNLLYTMMWGERMFPLHFGVVCKEISIWIILLRPNLVRVLGLCV